MSWASFVLLGLALAMDCFAVSLCMGLSERRFTLGRAVAAPFMFGLFQGIMPLLGWGLGLAVRPLMESFDHWVAFVLLLAVGGHMLKEAWNQSNASACAEPACADMSCPPPVTLPATRTFFTLLTLAVATSLDAMAVGLGMAFAEVSLWWPALIIGSTTFLVSLLGICLGQGLGRFIHGSHYAVAFGGCVLIGIGFKILMEHGVFQGIALFS